MKYRFIFVVLNLIVYLCGKYKKRTYRGMRIVYKYDDGFHDDFNISEELHIEYYD